MSGDGSDSRSQLEGLNAASLGAQEPEALSRIQRHIGRASGVQAAITGRQRLGYRPDMLAAVAQAPSRRRSVLRSEAQAGRSAHRHFTVPMPSAGRLRSRVNPVAVAEVVQTVPQDTTAQIAATQAPAASAQVDAAQAAAPVAPTPLEDSQHSSLPIDGSTQPSEAPAVEASSRDTRSSSSDPSGPAEDMGQADQGGASDGLQHMHDSSTHRDNESRSMQQADEPSLRTPASNLQEFADKLYERERRVRAQEARLARQARDLDNERRLVSLEQRVSGNSTERIKKPKLREPEVFKTSTDARTVGDFLAELERYFRLTDVDPAKYVDYGSAFLAGLPHGEASRFWEAISTTSATIFT